MPLEIERKFLVESDEWRASAGAGRLMRQFYLTQTSQAVVRLRIEGREQAVLTIKSAKPGLSRQEFEYPIPVTDAEALAVLREGRILEKTRFRVPYAGHTWEVDVYAGDHQGLVLAEIELASEDERWDSPPWLGCEVTGDGGYYASHLARQPLPAERHRKRSAWQFKPGEPLDAAFRRVATAEVPAVRALLSGPPESSDRAIHEARRSFKRLRALLRLANPALDDGFGAENRRLRDTGRLLAPLREATVLFRSFDDFVERHGNEPIATDLASLRAALAGKLANSAADGMSTEEQIARVLSQLAQFERNLEGLNWPANVNQLARSLRKVQARLRARARTARSTGAPEDLHEWRKRLKDHVSQMDFFAAVLPRDLKARRKADSKLAELLGDEHDLCILATQLVDIRLNRKLQLVRDDLVGRIEAQRSDLRRKIFRLGKVPSPREVGWFIGELCAAWEGAQGGQVIGSSMLTPIRLITRAADFAAARHTGQTRKDGTTPYINHLAEVASLVAGTDQGSDAELVAAAFLHDVVEDEHATKNEIEQLFGTRVLNIVQELTDDVSLSEDDRNRRQVEEIAKKSVEARLIKLADKISNLREVAGRPLDWSAKKRLDYAEWGEAVVNAGCRGLAEKLEAELDALIAKIRSDLRE
jgi:CYTH domain-containing protein/CHAD domain-containing protein